MQSAKTKAELQQHKTKLANSYSELLHEFSSSHLRHVGNYTVGKLVGKGSFGKVYLARHNLTNSKVVLKSSKKDDANLAREIHHHRQFIHPHIARLYEVVVTENLVWLVLEYCQGDELYNYLVKTGPLPIETAQKIFTQLVGAVAYIHSKSCVHRDLKLENVLLDKHENVKLCDFGFTREYEGKSSYLQTFCGTVCYSAPEMLKGEKYAGEKVDVWSLGVILFALLKGELPFDEDDEQLTKARILKDDPAFPDTFPEAAKSLILKLLSKRPLHRPTLADILADPFLADHAPQQQAILKVTQPSPFTTTLEKTILERMRSTGVDLDKVIENVLSQRCDTLAGWWALLVEKEQKKEVRREKKRKEKEAELKLLRRLSAASSRLDKITLENVAEEGTKPGSFDMGRNRSLSRGRTQRRSTPQILVTDLPRLPEGSAIGTPGDVTPPPPLDKDSVRSRSGSRPPIPPKEKQRRSSHLQIVTTNPDLLNVPNGVNKHRRGKRKENHFLHSLTAIKHWFLDTARIPKSPKKTTTQPTVDQSTRPSTSPAATTKHNREYSNASAQTRSSYGTTLTPVGSNLTGSHGGMRLDTTRVRPRTSISPITPSRAAYRHSGMGLKGRKSTSSSVSSVRSMHRHSKASSVSSNSMDTINSPTRSVVARSPHPSIKVLPTTPTIGTFPSNIRFVRNTGEDAFQFPRSSFNDESANGQPGVMFARRKKSPFKGPALNASLYNGSLLQGQTSPMVRPRESSSGKPNLGLLDVRRTGQARPRKSQIIEEEEEDDEDPVEEVEEFSPIDLRRGESVHSILMWDDPLDEEGEEAEPSGSANGGAITAAQLRELNERVEREKAAEENQAAASRR